MVRGTSPRRSLRGSERGLTLVEMLVVLAIVAVIAGSIGAVFSVGLQVVSATGPQARLLDAHDLQILEQDLGRDGARAACIQLPSGTHYGSCSHQFNSIAPTECTSSVLCIGWPQVSSGLCHVAAYGVGANVKAVRSEYTYSGGTISTISSDALARSVPVTITPGTVVPVTPAGEGYTWVHALPITIAGTMSVNPPTQTLTLQPVTSDPAGVAAALAGGVPC